MKNCPSCSDKDLQDEINKVWAEAIDIVTKTKKGPFESLKRAICKQFREKIV